MPRSNGPPVILLVEDSDDFRQIFRASFARSNFRVAEARNGLEALDYLQENEAPELIVLDLRMPVMDGFHFRALQRLDPRLRDIPVMIYSCEFDSSQDPIKELDAVGLVAKESGPRGLRQAVAGFFGEAESDSWGSDRVALQRDGSLG